ncbi:MAG: M48 family metalloprotease [Desulfobacterales bacterium]|nr:M48 family metalloprotease [Desulfobacterales bacterium]
MKNSFKIYLLIVLAIYCAGCAETMKAVTVYGPSAIKVAGATAQAARPIAEDEEYFIGRSVAANLVGTYPVSTDGALSHYVNLIGKTLTLHSDKPETFGGYHFAVLDSDEINAMACPGGIILITRGFIDLTESEDELAAVLAHEIAHIQYKDGIESIKESKWTKAFTIIAAAAAHQYTAEQLGNISTLLEGSAQDVVGTLVVNGYGKEKEYRADKTALTILDRSGYDPYALKRILSRLQSREKIDQGGFLKTHPDTGDRIEKLSHEMSLFQPDHSSSYNSRMVRFSHVSAY